MTVQRVLKKTNLNLTRVPGQKLFGSASTGKSRRKLVEYGGD
jgi:hypothetical protein